jgi:hypothetical protein
MAKKVLYRTIIESTAFPTAGEPFPVRSVDFSYAASSAVQTGLSAFVHTDVQKYPLINVINIPIVEVKNIVLRPNLLTSREKNAVVIRPHIVKRPLMRF